MDVEWKLDLSIYSISRFGTLIPNNKKSLAGILLNNFVSLKASYEAARFFFEKEAPAFLI